MLKTIRFIATLITAMSIVIFANGCSRKKLTEAEAREIAEHKFADHCSRYIHYPTNEFNPPTVHVGTGSKNEVCYQYIWNHKSENLDVVFGVSESGEITGGSGRIDSTKPWPPHRPKEL